MTSSVLVVLLFYYYFTVFFLHDAVAVMTMFFSMKDKSKFKIGRNGVLS